MGISIFSGLWTFLGTLIFALLLAPARKKIVKIGSGVLLKIICAIAILRAGMPFYIVGFRLPSILRLVDAQFDLTTAIDYKIDYYANDVLFESTPMRVFPALSTICIFVFLVVVLLLFAYDFRKYYYMHFHMKYLKVKPDERLEELAREVQREKGGSKKITVYRHPSIPFPSVSGFLRPVIFIPDTNWTETQLYDLIEHEYLHFLHGDHWAKLVLIFVKNLFWWNLPIHWLFKWFELACEYHCDHGVTRVREAKKDRLHYARTITKALEHYKEMIQRQKEKRRRRFSLPVGASGFALPHSDKFAKERFEAFLPQPPKSKNKSLSALIVLISLVLSVSSVAFIPSENYTAVDVVHGEYIYFVEKADGTFDMYMDGAFQFNIIATRVEIESMGPPEYIFQEVPDLETVKQIGGN